MTEGNSERVSNFIGKIRAIRAGQTFNPSLIIKIRDLLNRFKDQEKSSYNPMLKYRDFSYILVKEKMLFKSFLPIYY